MLSASCPKCAKQVTVPSTARPESRVRCPLCAEEYSLESIFAELPPLLVLLDAPAPNGTSGIHVDEPIVAATASSVGDGGSSSIFDFGAREEADAEAAAADKVDTGIALADPVDVAPATSAFDFGGATPAAESIGAGPRTTTARPKAKKASPLKSIIGVVVGGLVALPMAQLILWYLPGNWGVDQRDPMRIGRDYPGSFGLLAPSWVTSEAAVADDGPSTADVTEIPPPNNDDPPGDDRDDFPQPGNNDPPPTDNADDPPIATTNDGDGEEEVPPVDDPPLDPPTTPESRVKNAPVITAAELGAELKAAKEAEQLIVTAADPAVAARERIAAGKSFMETMGKFARALTFIDKQPEGHLEHVRGMMSTAGGDAEHRKIISTIGARSATDEHHLQGLLVVGQVREIQPRGELFETVLVQFDSNSRPISVYTASDPQEPPSRISAGNTVVALGVVIDKPNDNIAGYKGEPDPILWGGYWQVMPEE